MRVSESTKKELKIRFLELSGPMEPVPTETRAKLQKLKDIRFVIYDFYGTLFLSGVGDIGIDDGTSDAGLMNDALRGARISVSAPKAGSRSLELYSSVVEAEIRNLKKEGIQTPEPDIRKIWKKVLNALSDEKLIQTPEDEEAALRISVEFEARMNPVWPVKGVETTLQNLKQQGYHQGIISNSQFYTPLVLEALTGKTVTELGFDERLLHWSYKERMKKPDIDFYKRFLDALIHAFPDALPDQVLYIGNDMLKDVWPASQLGMKTALFAGDMRSLKWRRNDERCKNLEPDLVITTFQQLEEVL